VKLRNVFSSISLVILFAAPVLADSRALGPFLSELGQIRFELSDGTATSPGEIRVQLETDSQKHIWTTIYSTKSDDVIYVFPLAPNESSFLIEESLGSGYRTVILHVETPRTVVTQLDASGKDFPEMVRAGAEDTRFVLIPNAANTGDVIDVVDVYAFYDGTFKFQQRVAAGQELSAVQQLSRKIDQVAAERRKGVAVHP
jgi:hypothetical protein